MEPNDYQTYNSKSGPTVLDQDVMDDESTVEINTVPLHSSTPLRNVALETEIVHEVTDSRSDLESLGYSASINSASTFHGSTTQNSTHVVEQGLKVIYTNIDTFLNKREELETLINQQNPEVICLVEILPKSGNYVFNECEFSINGYHSYFSTNKKRGVAVYTKSGLNTGLATIDLNEYEEVVLVTVKLQNQDSLLIGCIYRSPSSDDINNAKLIKMLEQISSRAFSHLLIVGDFNCKEINWELMTTTCIPSSCQAQLVQTINTLGWHQHVNFHTRFRRGNQPSLLDLVITNEINMIDNLSILNPIGKSDHGILIFDYLCYRENTAPRSIPKYYLGNYEEMRNYFSQYEWKQSGDVTKAWDEMKSMVIRGTNKFIPKHTPGKRKQKSWIDRTTIRSIKMKHRAWNKFNRLRSITNWNNYTKARNYATFQVKKAKYMYEYKISKEIKKNPKCFWRMVREKTKVKESIPNLVTKEGKNVQDDTEKAEILNSFFVSVFTKENTREIPNLNDRPCQKLLEDILITETKVMKLLKNLKQSKSPGPDQIHNKVLYEIREQIVKPLTSMFQASLDSGQLPKDWKVANITPIFKKGKRTDPNNYRPVSLTSAVCKIMETMIRDEIREHMEDQELFSQDQHGFRQGRSCNTQLLEAIHDWTNSIEEGHPVDVIYLDYRKAFDSVPFERLLKKLHAYGVRGKVLLWIRDFLRDRSQRVVLADTKSDMATITSGIPQGSVLGPMLFLIYVNDLPEEVLSTLKLFADDTKLYREIQNDHDKEILQNDLNELMDWSVKWQLPFNIEKCKVLHLGKNNPKHKYSIKSGTNNEVLLQEVEEEKDLGIKFDSQLNFKQHIAECVSKANQRIGLIRRNFTNLDKTIFVTLYKSLVRPILEYGNTVWQPCFKQDSIQLEKVQRRATKLVKDLRDKSYETRLKVLNLPSLVYRRKRADMLQIYRIMSHIDKLDGNKIVMRDLNVRTRGHNFKLFKPRVRTKEKRGTLGFRAITDWNTLSNDVVDAENLIQFKTRLEEQWKTKEFKFDPSNHY